MLPVDSLSLFPPPCQQCLGKVQFLPPSQREETSVTSWAESPWGTEEVKSSVNSHLWKRGAIASEAKHRLKSMFLRSLYSFTSSTWEPALNKSWNHRAGKRLVTYLARLSVSGMLYAKLRSVLFNVSFDAEVSVSSIGDWIYYSPPCKEISASFKQLMDVNKTSS